jgi:hypothetical protein
MHHFKIYSFWGWSLLAISLFSTSVLAADTGEVPQTTIASAMGEVSGAIDRPRLINTTVATTAYTLNQGLFQVGFETDPTFRLLGISATLAEFRYGITDVFTVGVAFGPLDTHALLVNPKWNFYSRGRDSYTIAPWIAFVPRDSVGDFGSNLSIPLGLEFAMSRSYDDRHRIHLAAGLGTTSQGSSKYYRIDQTAPDGSIVSVPVGDSTAGRIYGARLSAAYELRVARRHGFSVSFSPEVSYSKQTTRETGPSPQYFANNQKNINFNLGIGYYFSWKGFGGYAGIEGGPALSQIDNDGVVFKAFQIASGSFGIDYRF